jgi:hypothetical protein
MEAPTGRAGQTADILMQIEKPCNIIREDSRGEFKAGRVTCREDGQIAPVARVEFTNTHPDWDTNVSG